MYEAVLLEVLSGYGDRWLGPFIELCYLDPVCLSLEISLGFSKKLIVLCDPRLCGVIETQVCGRSSLAADFRDRE